MLVIGVWDMERLQLQAYTNQGLPLQLSFQPIDKTLWRKCLVKVQSNPPPLPIFQEKLRNLVSNLLNLTLSVHKYFLNFCSVCSFRPQSQSLIGNKNAYSKNQSKL